MRLHEYEVLDIFEQAGIPVPRRGLAATVDEALRAAREIGYPVVLKAQVLVGGRGLAGGIKAVESPDELEAAAGALLSADIKGFPVHRLLVCDKVEVTQELYLGMTIDGYSGKPVIVVSTEGGVLIEKTARSAPGKIASLRIDPAFGLYPYQARNLLRQLGVRRQLIAPWAEVIGQLYTVSTGYEALICEINPIAVQPDGRLVAVDAVLEVDDSALSRIPFPLPDPIDRIENPLERRGREIGVTYVDLDGNIGLIASGAGLGMASMDIIGGRMKPANFLETGGGITADQLYKSMELIMMKPGLRGIFINVYGGINPIHEGARGIARYIREHHLKIPVVAKALGNRQEETWEILRAAGVHVVTEAATERAVARLYELVGGGEK
ncbi:MAG: succinate--CoA ligase subunit beta [Deltaproteobacteria bacterium]|nr:succinate--CoA ligase subunit beta [Deltaproteobacteria bacterium]